ncbi:MAG: transcription antitermination factor NusB [Chitinophagaceae bacterium]|nr:MAG: transcription antitermination factor NusB [Chitinophagaceae bacterium]
MISRRNIRVKVMQTLYTLDALESQTKPGEPQKILQNHFNQSRSLLVYLCWFLIQVAKQVEKEAHKRASKHLPSQEDLNVNTKIAGNELLWKMIEDPALIEQFTKEKPELKGDTDLVRRVYLELITRPEYQSYLLSTGREKQDEKKILEFIFNDLMLANENFVSHLEENFTNWNDDGEMVVQLLAGYLSKPQTLNFNDILSGDKALFARQLLQTVVDKDSHLHEIIIPKLKNWDPDRIALLDMILMKMGVAEFLYFETIPPKVTINEYIDLAKEYSTEQSGQFINGILDNIHKEMVRDGKMEKTEYRKNG